MTTMTPLMLEAALAAHDAGLCVIRGHTDGSKRPLGAWKEFQSQRPEREDVVHAFADNHPALMIVCGAVSGDLEMLELEGRAVTDGLADRIDARAHQTGVVDVLERVVLGYCERTPSGGIHLLYRCSTIDGNIKLARRPATAEELAENPSDPVKTLIETRGEGGVVMVAPSHGPTHGTGRAWDLIGGGFNTIATITPEEREALHRLMAEFDQAGDQPASTVAPVAARAVAPWAGGSVGGSWIDAVVAHLSSEMPMRQRLEGYGWTSVGADQRGELMCRPGKTDGVSGRINQTGRLMNWSTSAPFATASGTSRPTFDQLDVIAAYEHRGNRSEAARAVAERTGILAAWRREQDSRDSPVIAVQNAAQQATGNPNPMNLPDSFWRSRAELAHIRQAAHSRQRSADAVLGCVLARVAAFTPPCWKLPAIVGAEASLSTFVVLVGPSGAGKSSAKDAAIDLLPVNLLTVIDDLPLGSGEGLIENYFEWVEEDKPSGKGTVKVKRQTRHGAFLSLDEGQALADLGARKGSTLAPNLRSAWSGTTVGSANASVETRRQLSRGTYNLGLVIGLQPALASALLDDSTGGLPQRFAWFSVTDPTIPDERIEWPGPLPWVPPPIVHHGAGMTVHPVVQNAIRANDLARQRGKTAFDALDAHGDLVRLKLAGCLAILAGRQDVDTDDWALAGTIWRTGRLVRTVVIETLALESRKVEDARTAAYVRRNDAALGSAEQKARDSMARSIQRIVRQHASNGHCTDGCALRCARSATASKHRELIPIGDAVEHAEQLRWVRLIDGRLHPGEAQPT